MPILIYCWYVPRWFYSGHGVTRAPFVQQGTVHHWLVRVVSGRQSALVIALLIKISTFPFESKSFLSCCSPNGHLARPLIAILSLAEEQR